MSLFFRFWMFKSYKSPEICQIDRREAKFEVPSHLVSVFLQFFKIDSSRSAKAVPENCQNLRSLLCLHAFVDSDLLNLL